MQRTKNNNTIITKSYNIEQQTNIQSQIKQLLDMAGVYTMYDAQGGILSRRWQQSCASGNIFFCQNSNKHLSAFDFGSFSTFLP